MPLTKSSYAAFIATFLRALPRIYNKLTVPGICPITLANWVTPSGSTDSVPNMYSLHKLAVNTGHRFYLRHDNIWAQKTQPTYKPVSEAAIISQRIDACTQAFVRWPGNSPKKLMELHIPNFGTIERILTQFPRATFICDEEGIRFEGLENYPVLRAYNRSPQPYIPLGATECRSYAGKLCIPANTSAIIVPTNCYVGIVITATLPIGDNAGINSN